MTVINSNISALRAQASNASNARLQESSMERLSTGLRINSAKDDAAGLAISNRMTAQVNGLNQAVRNANDGLSAIATVEGALTQTTNVLQRMRELAVQASNDTNSADDRQFINAEVTQMKTEIDRISSQTSFNGMKVLDGTFTNKQFQIGANANETMTVNVQSAAATDIGSFRANEESLAAITAKTGSVPANPISNTGFTVQGSIGKADIAVQTGSDARTVASTVNFFSSKTAVTATAVTFAKISNLGAAGHVSFQVTGKNGDPINVSANIAAPTDLSDLANSFNATSTQTGITAQLSGDKTAITLKSTDGYDIQLGSFKTDAATKTIHVTSLKSDGATATGATQTLTSGAADSTRVVGDLVFSSANAFTLHGSATPATPGNSFVPATPTKSSTLSKVSDVNVTTTDAAADALKVIDGALSKISGMNADLGAIANRLEKTIDALTSSSTNTAAARSRILDTDYAVETSSLSKAQIIAQASNAMLAQANQQPQQVLSLLKQ